MTVRAKSLTLAVLQPEWGGSHLAKPNYAFAKRQRDLAKKQKKEAKRQRKSEANQPVPATGAADSPPSEKTTPDEPG
jgi:hypothetical protein